MLSWEYKKKIKELFCIIPRFYIKYFFIRINNIFKKKEEPGISIIIPCYNQGKYLEEAVQSVINQDYCRFEIIIVNDASSDNTEKIAKNLINKYKYFNIKLIINKKNVGVSETRNIGVKESNYSLVYFLDADDKIHPSALRLLWMFMQFHQAQLAYPGAIKFNHISTIAWAKPMKLEKHLFITKMHSGILIRKEAWKIVGGYSRNMQYGLEDWDFTLKFIDNNLKMIDVAKPLYYYRRKNQGRFAFLKKNEEFERKMLIQLIKNHPKLYSGYKIEDIVCRFRYREINEVLFRKDLEKIKTI